MIDLIGKSLGQYDITEKIGQGGMASVFRARQSSMNRDVAIKVISSDLAANEDFVKRFEHEAQLIARLEHAHILPVYDFGREGELIYLVMRLVDGGSLDRVLRKGPLDLPHAARLITQIASALDYAHNEGVIHRDLKPNNILMDKNGIPYLTDFGIAKLVQSSVALTATGTVMGTPSYMSPEQWRGGNVDARTDIYALGVMLYEMLTGQLPFTGDTPFVLMYKHFDEIPPVVNLVAPMLPNAINDVIAQAMAKNPLDRFASATQLAEQVTAIVNGETPRRIVPIPPTKPLTADELGGTVVGLDDMSTFVPGVGPAPLATPASILGATPAGSIAAKSPVTTPPQDRTVPVSGDEKLSASTTRSGLPRWLMVAAAVILVGIIGVGAFVLLNKPAYRQLSSLEGHTEWVQSVAWSKDGKVIASGSQDETIRLWDAETGQTLKVLRGHTKTVWTMEWNPAKPDMLATGSEDGSVRLWNPTSGELINSIQVPGGAATSISWNPDGTLLAIGCSNGTIYVADLTDPKNPSLQKSLEGAAGVYFMPVAWSPLGKVIAGAGPDNTINLWDVDTGKIIDNVPGHTEAVYSLSWKPDGSRLASTSHDGTVKMWDVTRGKAVPVMTIDASVGSGVDSAVWSPDGTKLATSSGFINLGAIDDKTVKIWDTETGKLLTKLEGHIQPVDTTAWSPDGSKLVSAGLDNVLKIWAMR